ncbi:hypothetical protein [Shimia biformata]|uniref:hypothetical protein n=1 Tax=Shimia biformata TaxID=1294299 RepID=UPI0019504F3C|nr:hypothetical protein [Shimia biformata]
MQNAILNRRPYRPAAMMLGTALALTACAPIPDNPTREGSAGAEIALVPGKNCYQNLCFYYDSRRNRVSIPGKEGAPVPGRVDISDGYMTPSEFRTLHQTAALAPTITRD